MPGFCNNNHIICVITALFLCFKVIHVVFIKDLVTANVCMTEATIKDALDKLRGAVMIVYPMNLPPHDPIRLEFEGNEDLTGTQVR